MLHPTGSWWRRAAAGVRAAIAGCATRPPDNAAIPRPRMLDCMELEDRVLFSAAPLAMAVAPHGGAGFRGTSIRSARKRRTVNRHDLSPHAAGQHALAQPGGKQRRSDRFPTHRQRAIDRGCRAGQQGFRLQQPNGQRRSRCSSGSSPGRMPRAVGLKTWRFFRTASAGRSSLATSGSRRLRWRKRRRHGKNSASVLAAGANIEIFGCNVAAPGSDGQNLLNALASVTHAAVFASTDSHGRRRQLAA